MQALRFGRKIQLPATRAIKHAILSMMLQDQYGRQHAGSDLHEPNNPDLREPVVAPPGALIAFLAEWPGPSLPPTLISSFPNKENPAVQTHRFQIGQSISYADDDEPQYWKGSFEIVARCPAENAEPRYTIRSPNELRNRIVHEHQLCEDLGARGRGE